MVKGSHHSKEAIEKLRESHLRENLSEETLEKMKIASIKNWQNLEYRVKHSKPKSVEGRKNIAESNRRPEVKAKHSVSLKITNAKPEVKARRSTSQKIAQNRPEVKEKIRITNAKPEVKARRSKASKLINARPEVKAQKSKASIIAQNRPEVKAKHSASLKITNAKPEVKARRRAAAPKGKDCHLYVDGSCCSGSLIGYHSNFTSEFRVIIRKRDNHTCMICKLTQEQVKGRTLSVHHIFYDSEENDCSNTNDFISLCISCHNKTSHSDRVYWQKVCEEIIEKNYCLEMVG